MQLKQLFLLDDIGKNQIAKNRAKREMKLETRFVLNRHGGAWVSHVPFRKMKMKLKQVRR